MKLRGMIFVVPAIPLVFAAAALSAGNKKPDLKEQTVFQFVSVVESETLGMSGGGGGMTAKEHNYQIAAKAVSTGQNKSIVLVAAKDSSFAKDIANLKPGDFFSATLAHRGSNAYDFAASFTPYTLQPGEDRPNVFLFVESSSQKMGGTDITQVKLFKLGMAATVNVPNVKDAATGKMAPDPQMLEVIAKLNPGDSIEVKAQGSPIPTVKSIDPYVSPQNALFNRMTQVEEEGVKTSAIEVNMDGKTLTILIPGKMSYGAWTPDAMFAGILKQLKEGDKVLVRYSESDSKCWLKEISKVAEKPGKP